jgi:DNA repair exonuclease SbcCD ATPase subunit
MPSLLGIFDFSHSDEFSHYQNWLSLDERFKNDPALKWDSADDVWLEKWPLLKDLWERVLPDLVTVNKSYQKSLEDELEAYKNVIKGLEDKTKLFIFYKEVFEKLTALYLDSLSGMLTEVYRSVYQTDTKSVQLVMEDFRNKKVIRLRIINHLGGKDYLEDFQSEGGAAQVILGVIVAIYFLLSTGGERIIFIDEGLSALHTGTLERFLAVLQQLRDSLGFVFVLVSHDYVRLRKYIDKVYTVSDGVYSEVPVDEFVQQSLEEVL